MNGRNFMAKTFINPKTLEFTRLEDSEVDKYSGWENAEDYVKNLQTVIGEILEDAEGDAEFNPKFRIGFVPVTWISLNKAKKLLKV